MEGAIFTVQEEDESNGGQASRDFKVQEEFDTEGMLHEQRSGE